MESEAPRFGDIKDLNMFWAVARFLGASGRQKRASTAVQKLREHFKFAMHPDSSIMI